MKNNCKARPLTLLLHIIPILCMRLKLIILLISLPFCVLIQYKILLIKFFYFNISRIFPRLYRTLSTSDASSTILEVSLERERVAFLTKKIYLSVCPQKKWFLKIRPSRLGGFATNQGRKSMIVISFSNDQLTIDEETQTLKPLCKSYIFLMCASYNALHSQSSQIYLWPRTWVTWMENFLIVASVIIRGWLLIDF